jgi:cytoskeletal protein CcmA (bactofilin family)
MTIAAVARRETSEITTLLGKGAVFEGKLTFEGAVRIDGTLKGEVFSDGVLIVGEGAQVEAEIDVGEALVQGSIIGNIRAKRSIELHASARVRGDLTTPGLQIAKGAVFEGRCSMENAAGSRPSGGPRTATTPGAGLEAMPRP